MILEIPASGEAISRDATIAAIILAEIWLVTMSVHCMRFTLVAKQACCRRKTQVSARLYLATVGLQVGVDKFAMFPLACTYVLHRVIRVSYS